MKPCFLVNNLNKGRFVYRACASALAQTIPCEVVFSDAQSTDNSMAEIKRAVAEAPRGADHEVRVLIGPKGRSSFPSCSKHFEWLVPQIKSDWILQCSSDDYSLPERARLCMEAVAEHPCSVIAVTQFFEKQGETNREAISGFPRESGYVTPEDGILKLGFGSVIAGYRKDFIMKAGPFGSSTPDVFWGFLAALDLGFYVVADPQHVHVEHAELENLGFQGKLQAAQDEKLLQLNELNHFQLASLYMHCLDRAVEIYGQGNVPMAAYNACANTVLGQTHAWLNARKALHAANVTPMVMQ